MVKLKDDGDYTEVLFEGQWIVFWTAPDYKSLLNAIGSTIGEVVKVDDNTKNGMRGLPTHMEAIVDLSKPLILRCINFHVLESAWAAWELTSTTFNFRRYDHFNEVCSLEKSNVEKFGQHILEKVNTKKDGSAIEKDAFGPSWIVTTHRKRKPIWKDTTNGKNFENLGRKKFGSRFDSIADLGDKNEECELVDGSK
ncbi:hypothetical protein GOBAR_AA01178 [Gossypium barbadense]|uniref:DUF4283 domain-containing protein n=1 Tax=Gossypium barbadense TaxID=3634 RepID=A0A2P5YV01_GOSBA|nr:hypothetical protein GOBAR_AA01178 [Gossypium barbadense]